VLREQDDNLSLLAHPDLSAVIEHPDLLFVESVLQDFVERANLHPDMLFEHVCSLWHGPLITVASGVDISEAPLLIELSSRFVTI